MTNIADKEARRRQRSILFSDTAFAIARRASEIRPRVPGGRELTPAA